MDKKTITSDVSGMSSLGYRRLAISQLKLMRGGLYVSSSQRKEKLQIYYQIMTLYA